MQEKAVVVQVDSDFIWLDSNEGQSGCNTCSAKTQCGTGLLSEYLQQKSSQLRLYRRDFPQLKLGDKVLISIEENLLIKISLLIYGLPLLMLLLAALISANSAPMLQIVMVIMSIGAGVWLAKQIARGLEQKAMRLIKLDLIV